MTNYQLGSGGMGWWRWSPPSWLWSVFSGVKEPRWAGG